jgi:hypothetical protein
MFLDFQGQLSSFDSTLIHVFGRFLRSSFLDYPKVPLIHWQTFFPISKGGISLVFAKVITLVVYLGN